MALQVGFASLGGMGSEMAWKLTEVVDKAKPLRVWNRTKSRCQPFVESGCIAEDTLLSLAKSCDIIMSFEFDQEAYEFIAQNLIKAKSESGEAAQIKIWVSMATINPDLAKEMASRLKASNIQLVSCPFMGRPITIKMKTATALLAGPESAVEVVRPFVQSGCARIIDIGTEPYMANQQKLVGNFFILTLADQLAQGYALGEKCGLSRDKIHSMLASVFPSPSFQGYSTYICKKDFELKPGGFSLAGGFKDAKLIKGLATASNADVPMIDSLLKSLEELLKDPNHENLELGAIAKIAEQRTPSA